MSSRRNLNFHYDYAEPYEEACGRNLTSVEGLYTEVSSASSSQAPSPQPADPNRPLAAQWLGGPQTPAPFPAVPPNPPRLYNPVQYHPAPAPPQHQAAAPQGPMQNVPPPPPFASSAVAAAAAPPAPRRRGGPTPSPNFLYIVLQDGFSWDKQSLALLGLHKIRRKKGWEYIADTKAFPGKTAYQLCDVWVKRKVEVTAAYEEVYRDQE